VITLLSVSSARDDLFYFAAISTVCRGYAIEDPPLEVGLKVKNGTATPQDILSAGFPYAGTWWYLVNDPERLEESKAFAQDDWPISRDLDNRNPDDPNQDQLCSGALSVLLIGTIAPKYQPNMGDWEFRLPDGVPVALTEMQYNGGWGWHSLPYHGVVYT
jgi:hypothetical protein